MVKLFLSGHVGDVKPASKMVQGLMYLEGPLRVGLHTSGRSEPVKYKLEDAWAQRRALKLWGLYVRSGGCLK